MNLLITGSESYLGKNLIKILSQNKYNIFTCDKSFSNKRIILEQILPLNIL